MFQQNKKNGDFNPIEGRREPSKSSPLAADLISVEAIAGRRSAAHIPKQPGPGGLEPWRRHRRLRSVLPWLGAGTLADYASGFGRRIPVCIHMNWAAR